MFYRCHLRKRTTKSIIFKNKEILQTDHFIIELDKKKVISDETMLFLFTYFSFDPSLFLIMI